MDFELYLCHLFTAEKKEIFKEGDQNLTMRKHRTNSMLDLLKLCDKREKRCTGATFFEGSTVGVSLRLMKLVINEFCYQIVYIG